jgi:mRNA interferase RelE/StbE
VAFKVEVLPSAEKQLSKFDKPIFEAAKALFERLETLEDPHSAGKALTGPLKGYWRYTIHGDWRAIAKIERKVLTIFIVQVAPRDKVYD